MSEHRARRAVTLKKVDYAKEQDFSDNDLFEDSPAEEAPRTKRRGRPKKRGTGVRTTTVTTAPNDLGGGDEEDMYEIRPVYTEKGYDPTLAPIRERFPFLPEYEEDGSPKIELIVGRRPVDEKEDVTGGKGDDEPGAEDEDAEQDEDDAGPPTRRRRGASSSKQNESPKKKKNEAGTGGPVEYEYLVKYKGRSYLHLEWKSGADLESMNKSAKGIYRRYIKKLAGGVDEELETPEFDPSFVMPEKIVDEAEQEIQVELTDKELLRWEKEREKELAEEGEDDEEDETEMAEDNKGADENGVKPDAALEATSSKDMGEEKKETESSLDPADDWPEEEIDFSKLNIEKLRAIVNRDGTYYPIVEGSSNPYRDGYVTEPPKKPRASYLFFQCTIRSYVQKKMPGALQSELMTALGKKWQTMSEEDRVPFQELAKEEAAQYEKEKALLAKAQKPNEVWQPLRRARMVLDRLTGDSFADIFLQPVDLNDFPDYEDFIDTPMDLGTVQTKLETRKYQAPEQFARDMRRIWNNCKIYNQHGSAIWHVADYMSKQFERLYHAWVLEFRERYLRWADPRARPWEHSCRVHDGSCKTTDDQMVLCDHCDAMYGIKCLNPPLKKIPKRAWHCPDCKPKLQSVKGARMLSAVAENAARKRAELGDLPKKKIKQTMYLVKWAGLGYEFCTWETKADVNDDKLIAEFHKLHDSYPDETDLPAGVVNRVLEGTNHINDENAGGSFSIPMLRSQLYAQSRAFQFSKFGMELPDLLCSECGPKTKTVCSVPLRDSVSEGEEREMSVHRPREVLECLYDMVFKVARAEPVSKVRSNTSLPPPMTGEYDVVVPITSKGLLMNVGEVHGSVAFLGYRQFPDGAKGPSELANLIRNVGDKIIAVDGVSTVGKSFKDVILMLRESGKNKFAYMRFLDTRYAVCEGDLASVGNIGRYTIEELQKKFTADRQRLVVHRHQEVLEGDNGGDEEEKDDSSAQKDSDEESADDGSEGEFQPDSDDEELALAKANGIHNGNESKLPENEPKLPENGNADHTVLKPPLEVAEVVADKTSEQTDGIDGEPEVSVGRNGVLCRHETTQSLAFRLLDVDVGYSSDEGGDENCAYFLDGVDETFTRMDEFEEVDDSGEEKGEEAKEEMLPARQSEFSALGDRAKLTAAIALSSVPPSLDDFANFPLPTQKEVEEAVVEEEASEELLPSEKPTKRSTVKVEQLSIATGETVHVWANIEAAAATLQLPLNDLRQVLRGEYDEDIGDEVGGFKWRYAPAGAKVTAGAASFSRGGGGKKAKEAWLEFRDKLYDPNEPHIYKNGNRLRDYQVDGVNWLSSTWYKKQGCVLADEMGLGKTVQIVCYIEHLFRVEKIRRPYLVVVPLSTVEHWRREFEGWTDIVCCIYHDRQRVWRDVLREYEWYYEDRPHTSDFLKFDVLVTTYDTLIGDFDIISQIPFRVAVVDEAHRLRNQKGKLLECMREISAKGTLQYGFQSRVLMSGTPLQNDLTELWTLLNFIEPFTFSDPDGFQAKFGNMLNREQVERLQQMISPFMLRRVKEDVAKDIPAKSETVIDVEMSSIQKQFYRAIFERNHAFLNIGSTRQTAPKLMNIQMELRKVCNHPYLLDGVEHREMDRLFNEFSEKGEFKGRTVEEQQHMLNEQGYVMSSGKMILLDKLLPKLRQEGHKVLLFSQMVKMLDLISEYCEFRGFRYERLDGRVRGTERQKAIDRFEREEDSFLFLLSTRAGGVGINLTAADICIIFDSDWNPQNDVQAQARCHRIGQTRDVRIYRLVTSRSFEQEMFDRASKKLGLEQAVLGTFEKEKEDDKPTQVEMEQLLKRGAYALLEDDNDEITKEFCADDIESILKKRTRTRVVEGTKTASWLNKQGMVVSKSKFSAEGGDGLDMDDPLFWQKVMPDFVTPSIMLQKLNGMQDEIEGTVRGPGRGRKKGKGRPKTNDPETPGEDENANFEKPETDEPPDGEEKTVDTLLANETLDDMSEDESQPENQNGKPGRVQLSRANVRKVQKFMSDLKSMMENIFEEEDEEGLSSDEKSVCQKLLLTITVKEKVFNEDQRRLARIFLKRLEGDRRRRCRTSDRFIPGVQEEDLGNVIPEQLRILGTKKKKKKRRKRVEVDDIDEAPAKKRRRRASGDGGGYIGEDGYLHHGDSEADWSDVGDDLYGTGKNMKDKISSKEARRRRHWTADDDDATAAGRAWPVFPRHTVKKVLATVLEEMMVYDQSRGGIFSEPVSRVDFPEYYEQIAKPMDYSTMKTKLENGEYRSAQAMQKDFILILQNCREFNSLTSDIVKEARAQHLLRPKLLKDAALKHGLFLAEDGSVLEIFDEESNSKVKNKGKDGLDIEKSTKQKKGKKKKTEGSDADEDEKEAFATDGEGRQAQKSKKATKKKKAPKQDPTEAVTVDSDENLEVETRRKPRIRISAVIQNKAKTEDPTKKGKKTSKRKRPSTPDNDADNGTEGDVEATPNPKKKHKKNEGQPKKRAKRGTVKAEESNDENESGRGKAKVTSPPANMFDIAVLKKQREQLDGSFDAARRHLTENGPWQLPASIEEKFVEVALATLSRMDRHDRYSVFAESVSEEEAPDYSEIVQNPMDFGTMKRKVADGVYSDSADPSAALYDDFLLVFDNCNLYNPDDSDVSEEASRVLGLLPEAFADACAAISKKR